MELWIEGSIDEVAATTASGLAAAIATNPTIMEQWTADGRTMEEVVSDVCQRAESPVYVQLHGPDVDTYLREMEALLAISDQIHPKLVATHAGIEATKRLELLGRKTLVTTIASVNQAFLAAAAGASYIAPYYGRIESAGLNASALIKNIADLYARHKLDTKIAAASLRNPQQIEAALLAGAHVIVTGYSVYQQMLGNPLTQSWIDGFEENWTQFKFQSD